MSLCTLTPLFCGQRIIHLCCSPVEAVQPDATTFTFRLKKSILPRYIWLNEASPWSMLPVFEWCDNVCLFFFRSMYP